MTDWKIDIPVIDTFKRYKKSDWVQNEKDRQSIKMHNKNQSTQYAAHVVSNQDTASDGESQPRTQNFPHI